LITEFENATLDNIEHYAFFVYPSIQDDTTIDDVASDILNRIVMSGSYNAKELGLKRVRYGYFKPFQSLKNVLATENIRICVVLDDFLADEKVSKILNDLRKLKRNGLSTLLISTEKTTNMSQFNAVFEMNPYSKDQLYDILKDAAKHVFHADTIDDEALQYCAEHVATNMGMRNGDLRKAQSILKSASIIAGHDLCKKVTKIHIEAVLKKEADKEEKRLLIMNKLNE
jgi:Cdc6-like AAA superfamily ATPase